MTVWVVTCCWGSKPCSVMVSEVFSTEAAAQKYVSEQEAMAANQDSRFLVWGREVK